MNAVFADSFYFFALLNPKDDAHRAALEFSNTFAGQLVTTAWIITELADGLALPRDRGSFMRILDRLEQDPQCLIVLPTDELFRAGLELFRDRSDQEWSLTDCISFVVMQREALTDALTGDHHFEQAGFKALFA